MLRRTIYGIMVMMGIAILFTLNIPIIPPEFGNITAQPIEVLQRILLWGIGTGLAIFGSIGVIFNPPLLSGPVPGEQPRQYKSRLR